MIEELKEVSGKSHTLQRRDESEYAVHLFYMPSSGITEPIRDIVIKNNKYAREDLLIPNKWHWVFKGFNNLMEAGGFMLFYVADNQKLIALKNFAKAKYMSGKKKLSDIDDGNIYPPFKGIVWYVGGEFSIGRFESYGEFLEAFEIYLTPENISKATLGLMAFLPLKFQKERIGRKK